MTPSSRVNARDSTSNALTNIRASHVLSPSRATSRDAAFADVVLAPVDDRAVDVEASRDLG